MTQASSDFLPTRWSLVVAAAVGRGGETDASREALETLARAYWFPLYAYVRRQGHPAEEAEDLTQEFFATLVEKGYLARAELHPSKGRFRAFLLACVKHFLSNQYAKRDALKRGGGASRILSLDTASAEARYALEPAAPAGQSPERVYERQWALAVLGRVLEGLAAEYAGRGEGRTFAALKPMLAGGGPGYAEIPAELAMTEGAVKTAAHRMRGRYRELLRREIEQTVDSPEEVDEEIAYLLNCL